MQEVWIFRLVVAGFLAAFLGQMVPRVRLIARASNNLSIDRLPLRLRRLLVEVGLQSRTIAGRPVAGWAHALVFWGFIAFAAYTALEFLKGLGLLDVTESRAFVMYSWALVPFSLAVLLGIGYLLVRRVVMRPPALGTHVSGESVLIGTLIVVLMVTFLLDVARLEGTAATINWWVHALVILLFLVVIPGSKHLHLLLSPLTVLLRSPELGTLSNLDLEQEEFGLEHLADLKRKQVLDAFTCVECGRCQVACPAHQTGKLLNPKALMLQSQQALLDGDLDRRLVDVLDPGVLWQCTTCGACETECPVGIEHLPLIIGARRGVVSNGEAPAYLGAVYSHLERRGNIWGLTYDQRQKFVDAAGVEIFDPSRHEYLVWLGCAGAFEADFQRALRSLFDVLRARGVTFGVLGKERCSGDPARRTGNEYLFQELSGQNIEELGRNEVTKIVTSCPHCLKTLGQDYATCGFKAEVVHSAVLVASLMSDLNLPASETVTFHDPCYLGRYAGHLDEPRALLTRAGANVEEPAAHGSQSFCCGAGGGLLFEEHEQGKRISEERFDQLRTTGADTVVTACPFCSIMLKGAQASADASTTFVDLMTFVDGRLRAADVTPATPSGLKPGGGGGRRET